MVRLSMLDPEHSSEQPCPTNPDLAQTGYASVLAGLPEELRRAYRDGDFSVGIRDADYQVIPTAWVLAAEARWKPDGAHGLSMTGMALDPAGGGRDSAELARRHGGWYAELISAKGQETADGSATAAMVVRYGLDSAPVIVGRVSRPIRSVPSRPASSCLVSRPSRELWLQSHVSDQSDLRHSKADCNPHTQGAFS